MIPGMRSHIFLFFIIYIISTITAKHFLIETGNSCLTCSFNLYPTYFPVDDDGVGEERQYEVGEDYSDSDNKENNDDEGEY